MFENHTLCVTKQLKFLLFQCDFYMLRKHLTHYSLKHSSAASFMQVVAENCSKELKEVHYFSVTDQNIEVAHWLFTMRV